MGRFAVPVIQGKSDMMLSWLPGGITKLVPTAGTARRTVRLVSATTLAVAVACALWALPAGAATAPRHPSTTIVSVARRAYVGARVRLSATVRSSGSTPTGTVTFWQGGRRLCAGRLSRGSTQCRAMFSFAGTKTITGRYSGDLTHAASTGTAKVAIVRSATTTKITRIAPDPVPAGQAAVITVRVTAPAGAPVATGMVKVSPANAVSPAASTCSAALRQGVGSCHVDPPIPHSLVACRATYSGNPAHTGSASGTTVLGVQAPTTTTLTITPTAGLQGQTETLTATVTDPAGDDLTSSPDTGNVIFGVSGPAVNGIFPAATLTICAHNRMLFDPAKHENIASCSWTPTDQGGGTYLLAAGYTGDRVSQKSDAEPVHLTVAGRTATTTTLKLSPAAGTTGKPETLTATVTDAAGDDLAASAGGTGTVSFYTGIAPEIVNPCPHAALTYDAMTRENVATCTITPTRAAGYYAQAVYSGDQHYIQSSDIASFTVTGAPVGHIYWASHGPSSAIGEANLDGTGVNQNFITEPVGPEGLAVDASHIYWTDAITGRIGEANLDGTGVNQNFITGPGGPPGPVGVAVDASHIYWANPLAGTIGEANLDGTGVNNRFITGLGAPEEMAVDASHIYWADSAAGTIGEANLDGTGVNQNFITGATPPVGVAVDASHIYWTNAATGTIGEANLDGTGVNQSLITGASGPSGVVVSPAVISG